MTNERSPETQEMLGTRSDVGDGTEEMVGRGGGVRVLLGRGRRKRRKEKESEKKVKKVQKKKTNKTIDGWQQLFW